MVHVVERLQDTLSYSRVPMFCSMQEFHTLYLDCVRRITIHSIRFKVRVHEWNTRGRMSAQPDLTDLPD
jgi:hypothetical protein